MQIEEEGIVEESASIHLAESGPIHIDMTETVDKDPSIAPAPTSINSRGRLRKASRKLMDTNSNSRLQKVLGFIGSTVAYTLDAPHFAYYEYKRQHFTRNVFLHAKTLHHYEVINTNIDSTYNYIHPLSFATSRGAMKVIMFVK